MLQLDGKDHYHTAKFAVTKDTGLVVTVSRDGGISSIDGSPINTPSTIQLNASATTGGLQLSGMYALIMRARSAPTGDKKFKLTFLDDGSPLVESSTINSDNSITWSAKWTPYTPPAVTASDAGKVLRVSTDGTWVAEAIENSSIPKIESLDTSNIKTFRSIEDGIYVLDGYFTPYTGSDSTFIFDPPALTSISSTATETHVQIFEAHDNRIQHLIVTDTSCEKTEVLLNDITKAASGIGDLSTLKTTAKDTLVNAINEAASAIPTVSANDNGKFLQVVDGTWAAADGNSSSDLSLGITGAFKNYGVRVKAIDENNRPTEWEAVDEQPTPLHTTYSDGTIDYFCAVPAQELTPTTAYELAKSCLKSANTKLWYPEGPIGALISEKPAALILTVSEDDTNIYAWYISKDGTIKSVATPKSIFTATE